MTEPGTGATNDPVAEIEEESSETAIERTLDFDQQEKDHEARKKTTEARKRKTETRKNNLKKKEVKSGPQKKGKNHHRKTKQ